MLPNIFSNIEQGLKIADVLKHYKANPAREQDSETRSRYFCPFDRCAGDKRPHFVVEHDRAVDAYGKRLDLRKHINQGTIVKEHWICEHSRVSGYGVVALVAAIHGMPVKMSQLTREQLATVVTECCEIMGRPLKELEDDARNGWLNRYPPQDEWKLSLANDFTPEALIALALDDYDGLDAAFITRHLHEDLGLWQVEKYLMAGAYPKDGRHTADLFRSYERRAHAFFPIFAYCYDYETGEPLAENPEKRTEPWVARIVMPAFVRVKGEDFDWKDDMWVALHCPMEEGMDECLKEWQRRFNLYGDSVAMETARTRDAQLAASRIGEELVTTEEYEADPDEEEEEEDGRKRKSKRKEIKTRDLDSKAVRLQKCVLCRRPLDAATVYMWLNYPRWRFIDPKTGEQKSEQHRNNFWHVMVRKNASMEMNQFENAVLKLIASDTFELFGNDRSEIGAANANAMRFNYLRLTMLPTAMGEMDSVDSGFGIRHIPHTPTDYFRYYAPTHDEIQRNMMLEGSIVGVKALILQKELNGSSAFRPFTKVQKKKTRPGEKPYNYEINLAACWQMMANNGYCRALQAGNKRNTVGRPYRIDGHFVYELDAESVMAEMRGQLADCAKDFAHGDVEDAEMMLNAMLRCKDLQNVKAITKLPLVSMPKSESYGPELDYFFFRNGALEITPKSIQFRRYEDLEFLIYRSQVLPFDYQIPFYGNQSPINIKQSEEYLRRVKEYEDAKSDPDTPSDKLFDMKQRLRDFANVGRWEIDIKPVYPKPDERMQVSKTILEDTEHNQWLRWWPFLRLLRCFANENWADEEAGRFTDMDRQCLMARMANLMFTIGRCIFRYRGGVQYMPYFLENTVDREGKAQGGSGKSFLINNFMSFVRNVLRIDGKDLNTNGDFAKNFSLFQHHYHDVVHIEDFPRMAIDPLFNYASGQFRSRSLYSDPVTIEHEEAPNIVISSNFMVQSMDESSLGRIQFGGMSHYFHREISVLNKEGRRLDAVMPMPGFDMENKPERWPAEARGQIIYTLAKCLQFCMMVTKEKTQVSVPGSDLLVRLSRTELGDTFYDWFTNFLSKPYIYNVPIAIKEIFNDYTKYTDTSKLRKDSFSRARFYDCMQKYCAKPAHGVLFMPIKPYLTASEINRSRKRVEDGTEKSYLRKGSAWFTRAFRDEKNNLRYARVLSKNAGDRCVTGGSVWFSRIGEEPKSEEEMYRMIDAFLATPDPEPILDENEQPITEQQWSQWTMLNTEEEAEQLKKVGGSVRMASSIPSTPLTDANAGGQVSTDDLPF